MIPRSMRTFWYKGSAENKAKWQVLAKNNLFLKKQPRLKGWFSQQVKKTMKSTIHKYVVNVITITNPTQYTKLGK